MTAYVTKATVRSLTGIATTTISDTDLDAIIEQAGRDIDDLLLPFTLSGSADDDQIVGAAVDFTKAGILDRLRLDGTLANTLATQNFSETHNLEAAIADLRQRAEGKVLRYAKRFSRSSGGSWIRKVNR